MSAPSAIWKPPPNATPCTAAITGTGSSRHSQAHCCGRLAMPWVRVVRSRTPGTASPSCFMAAKLAMSRPAQKALPSPDSTTQRRPFIVGELGAGLDDALEHRRIERVHLVGADQADVGHAVLEVDRNAVLHLSFSDFSHSRRRRFTSSGRQALGRRQAAVVPLGPHQHGDGALHVGEGAIVGQPVEQRPHLGLDVDFLRIAHRLAICQTPWPT